MPAWAVEALLGLQSRPIGVGVGKPDDSEGMTYPEGEQRIDRSVFSSKRVAAKALFGVRHSESVITNASAADLIEG
ncbi:MAG: hypothetical protein ABI605_18515 [Rhizobacter sp.]